MMAASLLRSDAGSPRRGAAALFLLAMLAGGVAGVAGFGIGASSVNLGSRALYDTCLLGDR